MPPLLNPGIKAHLENIVINNEWCLSVKSKKESYIQCPRPKKQGDYCGTHHRANNVTRIDELLASIKPPSTAIKEYQYPELQNLDQENLNPLRLQLSFKRHKLDIPVSKLEKNNFEHLVEILKNHLEPLYLEALNASIGPAEVDQCQNETDFFQFDNLSEIPRHFFFSFREAQPIEFVSSIDPEFDVQSDISASTNKQRCDGTTSTNKQRCYGPTSTNKQRCYGCDFRSFQQYIISLRKTQLEDANLTDVPLAIPVAVDNEKIDIPKWLSTMVVFNPYNRQPLDHRTLGDYQRKLNFLEKFHPQESLNFPTLELTPEQKLRFKVLDVFQIIYHYDYPVDHLWFLNLSRDRLLRYYSRLEEIWNFRLNLNLHDKKLIVPHNPHIFNKNEYRQLRHQNLFSIQTTMINHIEALVTQGQTLADRKNGAMYLLIGLVEVCPQAAQSLPYLAFSAGIGN